MPRQAHYVPHGVMPAVLLPFADDLSIDEKGFRKHLSDVAATEALSAITVNAHSTEVASCSFDEQRRILEIAQDEVGDRLPIVNGIWADGSIEAARIARVTDQGGLTFDKTFSISVSNVNEAPTNATLSGGSSAHPAAAAASVATSRTRAVNERLRRPATDLSSRRGARPAGCRRRRAPRRGSTAQRQARC